MSTAATKCPSSFGANNRLQYGTSALGCISFVATFCVFLLIYARHMDRIYRYRIILGVTIANFIFSLGAILPWDLGGTTSTECGYFTESIMLVNVSQGLFLWGKFMTAAYEIYMVSASLAGLKNGSVTASWASEAISHTLCVLAGMISFAVWMVLVVPANQSAYDIVNGNIPNASAHADFAYVFDVEMGLFRVWIGLFLVMVVIWLYQRVVLHSLLHNFNDTLDQAKEEWDRDLWNTTDKYTQAVRARKQRLLDMQKESYLEISRPLDPYIFVYMVFAIPSIVMATDFCALTSSNESIEYGCTPICYLVLSLRPASFALVFLADREQRKELMKPKELFTKFWNRLLNAVPRFGLCSKKGKYTGIQADGTDKRRKLKNIRKKTTFKGPDSLNDVQYFDKESTMSTSYTSSTGSLDVGVRLGANIPYDLLEEHEPT